MSDHFHHDAADGDALLRAHAPTPLASPHTDLSPDSALMAAHSSSADAVAGRLAFLASAFSAAGLATPDFPMALERAAAGPLHPHQVEAIVDGMVNVWNERLRWQSQMQQSQSEMDRLRSDLMYSTQRCATLKDSLADADKRAWEIEMKRRTAEKEALAREKALRADLAALEKKCVMIQRRDNQYKHDIRKSEQAFEKVQEKLHKLILEKTSSTATGPSSLGRTQSFQAGGGGGMDLSSTIRTSLRTGTASVARASSASACPPASSASSHPNHGDVALMQATLHTYSERMKELVGENLSLKAALKNMEAGVAEALEEQQRQQEEEGGEGDDASQQQQQQQELDDSGNPIPSSSASPLPSSSVPPARCLSPHTLSLLADFTPSQIELPWELVGQNVQKVLAAKLQLLRQGAQAARARQSKLEDVEWEGGLISALKAKISEQLAVISAQDELLQQALLASDESGREALLAQEEKENRRLSLRAEAEDVRRRKEQMQASTGALLQSASKRRGGDSHNQSWAASPASLRILGGHTASNLPVFATPAFVRKQKATGDDATVAAAGAVGAAAPPAARQSIPAAKSKWLQGGIVTEPVFTPSKPSSVRSESHGQSTLARLGIDVEDAEEWEEGDMDMDADARAGQQLDFDIDAELDEIGSIPGVSPISQQGEVATPTAASPL